ncbi:hypothetical protein AzCIB_1650 [Azoarcus sp. CIB]|uniref:hypothetical protein n=1 Tax=Aromatoleum sp. (strain CIB) TaxID=198107 RepID=UPI00067C18D6|nr:hypothetical protein [Azoarcus sp. CIB]AKU11551.1 hypothetical protein AzCIB_1650 [Azoarcus sp. CIB]
MAIARKRLGKTECPDCKTEMWVKESESGSLSATCPDCDYGVLLRKGTPAADKMRARFAAPDPAPEAAPKTETKTPARKPAFDLGL